MKKLLLLATVGVFPFQELMLMLPKWIILCTMQKEVDPTEERFRRIY